jgi:tRNA_anti-like
MLTTKVRPAYKKWLIGLFVLLLAGGATIWWIFTEKFSDTAAVKADHTVNALEFINEFKTDLAAANKKYTEKIVIVNGTVSEIKNADTTSNVIMSDSSGAYIIFAFQQQHLASAKALQPGQQVSVKGSCSGGTYSEILETQSISFKRCALNK